MTLSKLRLRIIESPCIAITKVSRGFSYRESGVAMIEFTLVFPLFLGIVFTILDVSMIIYDMSLLTNTGREWARASIVAADSTQHDPLYYWGYSNVNTISPTSNLIPNVIAPKDYCIGKMISLGSNKKDCSPAVLNSQADPVSGDVLTVQVTYPYSSLILQVAPSGLPIKNWTIPLSVTTTMRYE